MSTIAPAVTVAPVAPVANPAPVSPIDTLIREAGACHVTMTVKIKEAAKLAAAAMDKAKTPAEQVKLALAAHAVALAEVDHNVKSLFTDNLWLHAAPVGATVEVPVAGAPGAAKAVAQVPAVDAVAQSKHVLKAAAQQVREQCGAARASGGGRKPQQVVGPVTVSTAAANQATPTWFDELELKLKSPGDMARIIAAIERAGYKVTRAEGAAPAATTNAAATEKLAQALADTVPASALAQAAAQAMKGASVNAAAAKRKAA